VQFQTMTIAAERIGENDVRYSINKLLM